jgi:hypothetical protein
MRTPAGGWAREAGCYQDTRRTVGRATDGSGNPWVGSSPDAVAATANRKARNSAVLLAGYPVGGYDTHDGGFRSPPRPHPRGAPMITVPADQTVNIFEGKFSYLTINSKDEFTAKTDVTKVVEKAGAMVVQEWTPKVSKAHGKDQIRVRLKAKKRVRTKEVDPDGGTLTITVVLDTSVPKPMDLTGAVKYVNDDET